jgi:hypothetical protein
MPQRLRYRIGAGILRQFLHLELQLNALFNGNAAILNALAEGITL